MNEVKYGGGAFSSGCRLKWKYVIYVLHRLYLQIGVIDFRFHIDFTYYILHNTNWLTVADY